MASYAAIASKPGMPLASASASASASTPVITPSLTEEVVSELEEEVTKWVSLMGEVTTPTEQLAKLVEVLRREMEMPPGTSGFRGGSTTSATSHRNFGSSSGHSSHSGHSGHSSHTGHSGHSGGQTGSANPNTNWRSGFTNSRFASTASAFDTRGPSRMFHDTGATDQQKRATDEPPAPTRSRAPVGRYQSRFKSSDSLEDKILNTVIGNKLNAFTPLTYNDTRDFIYQIIDSGETEFTRDFIEKVFVKAVVEDLYCALFAKLIAEIAHRYPVIYEEMNKYHKEFLKIFDNVQEDTDAEYTDLVKEKQYRMGYGQFIAELAGLNALEKGNLMTMVSRVIDKIYTFSTDEKKIKTVEEFIDCLVRLTKGLQTRSPTFFKSVKSDLVEILKEKVESLILRSTPRPSLSNKARFGLMDLKDIIDG